MAKCIWNTQSSNGLKQVQVSNAWMLYIAMLKNLTKICMNKRQQRQPRRYTIFHKKCYCMVRLSLWSWDSRYKGSSSKWWLKQCHCFKIHSLRRWKWRKERFVDLSCSPCCATLFLCKLNQRFPKPATSG